jgi:hypothetical protein
MNCHPGKVRTAVVDACRRIVAERVELAYAIDKVGMKLFGNNLHFEF